MAVVVPFAEPLNRAFHGGPVPFAIVLGSIGAIAGLVGSGSMAWAWARALRSGPTRAPEPAPTS